MRHIAVYNISIIAEYNLAIPSTIPIFSLYNFARVGNKPF